MAVMQHYGCQLPSNSNEEEEDEEEEGYHVAPLYPLNVSNYSSHPCYKNKYIVDERLVYVYQTLFFIGCFVFLILLHISNVLCG